MALTVDGLQAESILRNKLCLFASSASLHDLSRSPALFDLGKRTTRVEASELASRLEVLQQHPQPSARTLPCPLQYRAVDVMVELHMTLPASLVESAWAITEASLAAPWCPELALVGTKCFLAGSRVSIHASDAWPTFLLLTRGLPSRSCLLYWLQLGRSPSSAESQVSDVCLSRDRVEDAAARLLVLNVPVLEGEMCTFVLGRCRCSA